MVLEMVVTLTHHVVKHRYLLCIIGWFLIAGLTPFVGASAPDIIQLSPDTGYAGFSYLVTLTGEGLSENMSLGLVLDNSTLNITDMTYQSNSSLTFRVAIPIQANPGLYQMVIRSPDFGEQRYNQVFHVQPPAAPVITNISPSSAMAGSSITVTITGTYFRSGCSAFLTHENAQIPLTNLTVRYDQISGMCTLPALAHPGAWNLSVINPDGQNAIYRNGFSIRALPPPMIQAITPDQGGMNTPVQVAITGNNFLDGATITLSRRELIVPATDVKVDSPGRIIATILIPQKYHEGLWDLTVTNPDGQSAYKPNAYLSGEPATPLSLHIYPSWGIQGKECTVTLRGMAFLEGDRVTLQRGERTISARNITIASPTTITCTIPIPDRADEGAWDVVVTNRYNKSDRIRGGFFVYSSTSLLLAGNEPDSAEQGQYLILTIFGNNFVNNSSFSLSTRETKPIQSEKTILIHPGEMKAWFHIPSDAVPDLYDLTMTTPSRQKLTKTGALRILYNNTPFITTIDPDRAPRGTKDLKIIVTGNNFGDGEFLNLNLTYNTTTIPILGAISYKGTRITGYVTIPNETEPGWYALNVTRDAGLGRSSSKPEMFRIL